MYFRINLYHFLIIIGPYYIGRYVFPSVYLPVCISNTPEQKQMIDVWIPEDSEMVRRVNKFD